MSIVNDLIVNDQPIRACHWYACKLFQTSVPLCHSTPTQYYFNAKRAITNSVSDISNV